MSDDKIIKSYFKDPDQAANYQQFRPAPPTELLDKILLFLEQKLKPPYKLAVDVGCGTGGSTTLLADHFAQVMGFDISEEQIHQAQQNTCPKNVSFKVGQANELDVANCSVELITVATAAHWFNLEAFYKEVDRVLVPNGVLALYCNLKPTISDPQQPGKIETVFNKYMKDWILPNMPDDVKHVENQYRSFSLPYSETLDYRDGNMMEISCDITLMDVAGYIKSTSGYQLYIQKHPEKKEFLLQEAQNRLMQASREKTSLRMIWKYFLVMARKTKL